MPHIRWRSRNRQAYVSRAKLLLKGLAKYISEDSADYDDLIIYALDTLHALDQPLDLALYVIGWHGAHHGNRAFANGHCQTVRAQVTAILKFPIDRCLDGRIVWRCFAFRSGRRR